MGPSQIDQIGVQEDTMQGLGTHRHVLQEAKRYDVHDYAGAALSRCPGLINRAASFGANSQTKRAREGREEGSS